MIECLFCRTPFKPGKSFAKFCCAKCRVYWNRQHKQPKGPSDTTKQPLETISIPLTEISNRFYLGIPIPADLKGIDLTIWKQETQQALDKKPP